MLEVVGREVMTVVRRGMAKVVVEGMVTAWVGYGKREWLKGISTEVTKKGVITNYEGILGEKNPTIRTLLDKIPE